MLVIILTLSLFTILQVALSWILSRVTPRSAWRRGFVAAAALPLSVALWSIASLIIGRYLLRHFELLHEWDFAIVAMRLLIVCSFAWFLLRWTRKTVRFLIKDHHRDRIRLDKTAKVITLTVVISAALVGLDILGVSLSGLLAIGGLSGILLGFAGKDVLSNLFSGLMLYITHPFAVGDLVRSGTIEGRVEEIGWYFTTLRTSSKQALYVPNCLFSTLSICNESRMSHYAIEFTLNVEGTNADTRRFLSDMREHFKSHALIDAYEPIRLYARGVHEGAYVVDVQLFAKTRDKDEGLQAKEEVLIEIRELLAQYQLHAAVPTAKIEIKS